MEQQIQRLCHENELLQHENGRLRQICINMEENPISQIYPQQQISNVSQKILSLNNKEDLNTEQQVNFKINLTP